MSEPVNRIGPGEVGGVRFTSPAKLVIGGKNEPGAGYSFVERAPEAQPVARSSVEGAPRASRRRASQKARGPDDDLPLELLLGRGGDGLA